VIAGIFIKMPALQIFISAGFALFSAAVILLQTSQIVRGGETNYIVATVNLYVSLYNMFLSILSLLGMSRD
jgi:modulator of FtsH protease